MDLNFSMGEGITMDFSIGGGEPTPPTPSDTFHSITDDFHRVEEHMLMGTVTSEWNFTPEEW